METRKIILSADSTCDLSKELKERYQVNYFPLHIILDGKDYSDNVDITPEEVYQAFYDKKILPKTAAVNVAEYMDYFAQWVEKGYEVVHLNLGGALSSSHQNAMLAAEELGNVYPIDSCNLSTGIGLLVIKAAELIQAGKSGKEIQEEINQIKDKVHASFVLDTLTFLSAGGRCSGVVALGASILNLKPCILVDNTSGAMTVGKKYRGNLEKVIEKYVKDTLQQYENIDTSRIFITHSGIEETHIEAAKKAIEDSLSFEEIYITKASCTISSHCGPNTLGILFMTK